VAVTAEITASPTFPAGAVVNIYEERYFPGTPVAGKPPGPIAAVKTATVAANGSLTIPGCEPEREYVAGAEVGGAWRYVSFFAPPLPKTEGVPGPEGAQGERGPAGPTGAQGPTGPIGGQGPTGAPGSGMNWRGAWAAGTNYNANDNVSSAGSTWLSLASGNVGHTPATSPEWWGLVAQKGADGTPGATGATGPTGVTGATGPQGPEGPKGTTGTTGATGATGATGPAGPEGKPPGETLIATAYRKAAQKIPSAAFTRLQLDTLIDDPGSNVNVAAGNGWYTVPKDGYYAVHGEVGINIPVGSNYVVIASVFVNGAEVMRGTRWNQGAAGLASVNALVSGIAPKLKAGDKIELAVWQNGPETELVTAEGAAVNRLSVSPANGQGPPGPAGPGAAPEAWKALAPLYVNGCKDEGSIFQTGRYRKNGDRVELEGQIKVGGTGGLQFTLPAGYNPKKTHRYYGHMPGAASLLMYVEAGGEVMTNTTNETCSLDGIGWSVE